MRSLPTTVLPICRIAVAVAWVGFSLSAGVQPVSAQTPVKKFFTFDAHMHPLVGAYQPPI